VGCLALRGDGRDGGSDEELAEDDGVDDRVAAHGGDALRLAGLHANSGEPVSEIRAELLRATVKKP
jgi:hypothetical protein